MLIVAVFTVVKFWNQPWCPPTDGRIKKINWIYMIELLFGYKEQNYIICRKIEQKTIMLHKISHMTWLPSQLVTSSLRCWQPHDFTAILVNTTIWHSQEITTPFEFPVTGHSVTHPNPLLSVGFYLPTYLWHHGNRRPLSCDKVSAFPTSLRRPDINNTRPPLWINFFDKLFGMVCFLVSKVTEFLQPYVTNTGQLPVGAIALRWVGLGSSCKFAAATVKSCEKKKSQLGLEE